MISKDLSACFQWLIEDWQSLTLGLTPNLWLMVTKPIVYFIILRRVGG